MGNQQGKPTVFTDAGRSSFHRPFKSDSSCEHLLFDDQNHNEYPEDDPITAMDLLQENATEDGIISPSPVVDHVGHSIPSGLVDSRPETPLPSPAQEKEKPKILSKVKRWIKTAKKKLSSPADRPSQIEQFPPLDCIDRTLARNKYRNIDNPSRAPVKNVL